jgi:glycosyltransferase involved in cell wall biosynthesis
LSFTLARPFISVCLLAHNSASYITTALESVLAQSFQDWELLVSDDASTDETGNLVKPYLEDSRIRYVLHRENLKQANNWAFAIANTSAPIIATLHADDAWEPDALQTFANAFREQDDLDLVWANWDFYDTGLKIRQRSAPVTIPKEMNGNDACSWLVDNNHTLPSATAFTREVAQRAGSPDPRFGMLCDRWYFLRLPMVARRCRAIPKVVMRYRRNEEGVTSLFSRSGRLQEEMIVFANDADDLFRAHPRGSELAKRLLVDFGKSLFLHGLSAVMAGDRSRGTRWIKNAAKFARWALFEPSMLREVARTIRLRIFGK